MSMPAAARRVSQLGVSERRESQPAQQHQARCEPSRLAVASGHGGRRVPLPQSQLPQEAIEQSLTTPPVHKRKQFVIVME